MDTIADPVTPSIDRQLTRVYPRSQLDALLADAEHVRALLEHPGWNAVKRLVKSEVESIDRGLDSTHHALDQADYALQHGRRGGLRAVFDAAHAIVRRAQDEEARVTQEDEIAAEPAISGR